MDKRVKNPSKIDFSPYRTLSRQEWARLRADTPMTLTEADMERISGLTERLSECEVVDIYLPLSRLLNFHVLAAQELHKVRSRFLRHGDRKLPFIIGMAGSVAVGKSTTARALRELLAAWPGHPRVGLVPTDGFLLANKELERRGLMNRKGFPESYDTKRLLNFLADIKAGKEAASAPVYDHLHYDIVPGKQIVIRRPDILIVEGLNVLQPARLPRGGDGVPFVSDFFDFSIYIDANADLIGQWYVERFMRLRQTTFQDPGAYFHRYAKLSDEAALGVARHIWKTINLRNLSENILPTRKRADLILRKGPSHAVHTVSLRKL